MLGNETRFKKNRHDERNKDYLNIYEELKTRKLESYDLEIEIDLFELDEEKMQNGSLILLEKYIQKIRHIIERKCK